MVIFDGIMRADFYVAILQNALIPFINNIYPDGCRFQQDNDPKHTSRAAQKLFDDSNIMWWKTPPESPDLNPIEMVWHQLKHHLRRYVKPTTKDELVTGISDFLKEKMTPTL